MALVVDPAAGGRQLQGHQIRRRGALLIQDQNVALFREFPARADNSLHLRNTGRLAQAQGLAYFQIIRHFFFNLMHKTATVIKSKEIHNSTGTLMTVNVVVLLTAFVVISFVMAW